MAKRKTKRTTYYMHTLDGLPAVFINDRVWFGCAVIKISEMASSLRRLRAQQELSREARGEPLCNGKDTFDYGYKRIVVDR